MRLELCLPAMVTCARHSMVSEHQHHRLIVYCLHHIPVQANGTKIIVIIKFSLYNYTVRVEHFEVVLISRFSWVADDTKIIHVEGGINTREIF